MGARTDMDAMQKRKILLLQRIKQPGREADHPQPYSAEVKNYGAIPPFPHVSSWSVR
jgi:hypothetical protein